MVLKTIVGDSEQDRQNQLTNHENNKIEKVSKIPKNYKLFTCLLLNSDIQTCTDFFKILFKTVL